MAKFKLLRIGFAACHFTDGSWKSTWLPVFQCLCHEASRELLAFGLEALIHIFQTRHGIHLVGFVLECFWDDQIEAMENLKELFPEALIHLCLEHAKRNLAKQYPHTGFKQLINNTIDMIAFTPPVVVHVCVELLLASSVESWQDTPHLTTARQGGALIATGAIWSSPYASRFRDCTSAYSTYVPQIVKASWKVDDILFGCTKKSNGQHRIREFVKTHEAHS